MSVTVRLFPLPYTTPDHPVSLTLHPDGMVAAPLGHLGAAFTCAPVGWLDILHVSAAASTDGGPAAWRGRGTSGRLRGAVHRMAQEHGIG